MFGRKNKKEANKNSNVEAGSDMTKSAKTSNCGSRNCSSSSKR